MDKDHKVTQIPINTNQRKINSKGKGCVPCQISDRWLQIDQDSGFKDFVKLYAMTIGSDGKDKKLCEMHIKFKDLVEAVKDIDFTDI